MRKIIVLEHISLDGEVAQYEDRYRLCYMETLRASSSWWPRNSSDEITAFGDTGGAPSTRYPVWQPSCFLAYLRRGFVRRT
jgi:hypothetical protein